MQPIRFLKQRDVEVLRKNIRENLPWYRNEKGAPLIGEPPPDSHESMSKTFDWCFDALNENTAVEDDLENTIRVYEAFRNLSPQQAADERIWAYATHFAAPVYTAARWHIADKKDDDKAVNSIRRHYFGSGVRGFTRDNAVSRLWWIGHAATRCDDYKLEDALKLILWNQDVRKNLLERSLGMSPEILGGLVRTLGKNRDKAKKDAKGKPDVEPPIYKRAHFRPFMRQVHRRGGRIMLNILSKKQLDELFDEMVKQVIPPTQEKT